MARNDQQGIDTIQCGRIDYYIPFVFETKSSFEDICKKINNELRKDFACHNTEIQQSAKDCLEQMQDDVTEKRSAFGRTKQYTCDRSEKNRHVISRENMKNVITLGVSETGIKVEVSLEEMNTYHDKRDELIHMYEKYKEIYGLKFTNSQEIFVLFPLHIQLNNGEYVWLSSILFVFQNKMGILKLELPLSNVSSQPIMDNTFDEYIKKIEIPWAIDMQIPDNTIENIWDAYKAKLISNDGISVRRVGDSFRNVLLSDFTGMPKQISNIPKSVMVDLYRIIAAPITIMDCTSYESEAQEYLKEHQWTKHNSRYVFSTTGRCLSITDIAFRDYFVEMYKEACDTSDFDEQEIKTIYGKVVNNLCLNVEYAIIIMVLKCLNTHYFYQQLLQKPYEMLEVKRKFNINVMYISELQEGCFGTVSEQLETMEKVMPYYLKEKVTVDKLKAIDCILVDEEAQRQETFQNVLAFLGLVIAALFGLPAICETTFIVRKICSFMATDIPVVTIENISVLVWVLVIAVLIFMLVGCKMRKKRRLGESK